MKFNRLDFKSGLKKTTLTALALLSLSAAAPAVSEAATVYYKGVAVNWDFGRTRGVYSFSTVQSSVFKHGATANSTYSGLKNPRIVAHAEQYIGFGRASAYWNCV
ncbi:MAG: hypothetical protein LBT37_00665 [Lactobacillaceae bacterium]|jgi:hypothetical protein|nr:hypothetical protein [Lactobacillaceae bacterium]